MPLKAMYRNHQTLWNQFSHALVVRLEFLVRFYCLTFTNLAKNLARLTHCAEPIPSISLNWTAKCDQPKNKWLSQLDWLNQSAFTPEKLSTNQLDFPMKQPTNFDMRNSRRNVMIWVDQADLLKSVNKWLEKSPDLFPNNDAFFFVNLTLN
ncbi:hypothetical protein NRI82_004678 [Vibrio vulnificus]|nr:hypothetical protein [Vibrio vulnificus]